MNIEHFIWPYRHYGMYFVAYVSRCPLFWVPIATKISSKANKWLNNNNNANTCWTYLRINGNGLHCPFARFQISKRDQKNQKKKKLNWLALKYSLFCRMKHNVRHSHSHSKCVVTNYTTLIVVRYIRYVQCTSIQSAALSTWIIC